MIIHLNGQLMPAERATISPFDRGFIFGDGIYEGLRAYAGRVAAIDRHIARMRDGLAESRIAWDPAGLGEMSRELIEANGLEDAFIYWQVTRGVPASNHPVRTRIPAGPTPPTVFGFCTPQPPIEKFRQTIPTTRVALREDTRWLRGRLKSISLLGNVLGAIEAYEAGAQDAILVRDGLVGEGTCANVLLAVPTPDGRTEVVTPSLDSVPILGGVTRAVLLEAAPDIKARPVRVEELFHASEIMLCGTTSLVTSVVAMDGRPVGTGEPGPQARRLLEALIDAYTRQLGLDRAEEGSVPGCRTTPAVA